MLRRETSRDVGEWGHDEGAPQTFLKRGNGAEVPFYRRITRNFMVYQDRLESYLLQLFAHPEAL